MESIGTSLPATWLSRRQPARVPPPTHVIAGSLPASLLSSRARGWDGLVVELFSFSDLDVVVQAPDHVIAVHLAGTVTLRRTLAGRTRTRKVTSGDITITPVGPRVRWQQTSPSLVILLRLAPEYVRHMAGDECAMDPDRFEIQNVFATRDAIIENRDIRNRRYVHVFARKIEDNRRSNTASQDGDFYFSRGSSS